MLISADVFESIMNSWILINIPPTYRGTQKFKTTVSTPSSPGTGVYYAGTAGMVHDPIQTCWLFWLEGKVMLGGSFSDLMRLAPNSSDPFTLFFLSFPDNPRVGDVYVDSFGNKYVATPFPSGTKYNVFWDYVNPIFRHIYWSFPATTPSWSSPMINPATCNPPASYHPPQVVLTIGSSSFVPFTTPVFGLSSPDPSANDLFSPPMDKKCECGADFTSNSNCHSRWCPCFNKHKRKII